MKRVDDFNKTQMQRSQQKPHLNRKITSAVCEDASTYEINFFSSPILADPQEAQSLLSELQSNFNKSRLSSLLEQTEKDILHAVVGPFGLGKVLSAYDKTGGNVTTSHNFEKGVVATEQDQQRYAEWQESVNNKVDRSGHDDAKSDWKKKTYQKMSENDAVIDGYTDLKLGEKHNNQISKSNSIDAEHVTSVSEIERDAKNHLFANGQDKDSRKNARVKMSGDETNLLLTDGGLNSSKGDRDLMEWANSPISKEHAKETGNPNMTNAEYYQLNEGKIKDAYKRSKRKIKTTQITNQVRKQGLEVSVTGAKEGFKTGLQQALGMLILEFMTQSFNEIKDLWHNGMETDALIKELSIRVKRIATKLKDKWKDVFKAFGEGFLSGFLSNLVTVAINAFATTGKRIVRIIREGFFSLLQAIKLLLFPPADMSSSQAAHEAFKIILGAGAVALGVFCEEALSKFLDAIPFANLLVAVIIGCLTAICTSLIAYSVDRLDLFNVVKIEEDKFILQNLDQTISENTSRCDELIDQCDQISARIEQALLEST
jgi:hypothetical protein